MGAEPWDYAGRAAEILRHEWVAATVESMLEGLSGSPPRLLDVGCSLGQISERLAPLPVALTAMDVSVHAVRRAHDRISGRLSAGVSGPPVRFVAGSAVEIPFRSQSFDLVIASDGLYSWDLSETDRAVALAELHRVLVGGGWVVLTEHMRRHRFDSFIAEVRSSAFRVQSIGYLYDRPWYQFESWMRAIQHWRVAKQLRRNTGIARSLRALGRLAGRRASRHLWILARKPDAPEA